MAMTEITLLIDVGNTRLKWMEQSSSKLSQCLARPYGKKAKIDVLAEVFESYQNNNSSQVNQCIVVHVQGQVFSQSLHDCAQHYGAVLHEVKVKQSLCGIRVGYDTPEQLGADRLVAMIAAHHLYPDVVKCVIDCGTAVTIDTILPTGEHLGGVILPGLQLWKDVLITKTQRINANQGQFVAGKFLSKDLSNALFAKNTDDGIHAGAWFGLVNAIQGIVETLQQRFKEQAFVTILAGGDAHNIAQSLKGDFVVVDDLVMQGLNQISSEQHA